MKKMIAIFLTLFLLVSVTACKKAGTEDKTAEKAVALGAGFVFRNEESMELGVASSTLVPEDVYAKLAYTPEMFFGSYRIFGGTDAEKEYAKSAAYTEYIIENETKVLTTLPIAFRAGVNTLQHKISFAEGYNWAEVSFMRKLSDDSFVLDYFYCAYEIADKKLRIKPLDTFAVDDTNEKITLDFSDAEMTYDFSFKGRTLTLSDGKNSIDLKGGLDAYGKHDYFYTGAYVSPDSKRVDDIFNLEFLYNAENSDTRFVVAGDSDRNNHSGIAKLQENGIFTFTVQINGNNKTYQFVYFYGGRDGLVLTDGTDIFYYNLDYSGYHKQDIRKYLSEEQEGALSTLDENAVKKIVEKKEDLLTELAKAFAEAGIQVNIDRENGELAIDSSILFGGDSAELSSDGKAFLNQFVSAYTKVVFSDKYNNFISKTVIEGHTAPLKDSTYESGLALSEERANVVKAYCLSMQTSGDAATFAASLEAVGMSNANPIRDANGNVDLAASRRVSFKFIINV